MGVLCREGRVSVVEKSGRLYLRANIPGTGDKWLKTDCTQGELAMAIVKAKELDLDLTKARLGIDFPLDKYLSNRKEELKSLRRQLGIDAHSPYGEEVAEMLQAIARYEEVDFHLLSPSTKYPVQRTLIYCKKVAEAAVQHPGHQNFSAAMEVELGNYPQSHRVKIVKRLNTIIRRYLPNFPLLSKVKQGKKREQFIVPFSVDEREKIIAQFFEQAKDRTPQWEYDITLFGHFCRFCFYTGCRPGEASGLNLSDVEPSRVIFHQRYGRELEDYTVQPGLKTQDKRIFPINSQLRHHLDDYISGFRSLVHPTSAPLFVRYSGERIRDTAFRYRWVLVLDSLGIPFRKPYYMRHTFITECLGKGIPVATVAKWVGNSPDIIYTNYAGAQDIEVPDL